ncbi:MAG: sigma-54-dependent Fis family transcriptional regulator [Planctomycetes bacterium]|nr:sigma-54-dependent Fis family transcriptional regulator [Planctomycetota bacterium]
MKPASILIVEDEKLIRDTLRRRLTRDDHRVQEAERGDQALELIKSNAFEVVLLDYRLPDTDGLAVLRKTKSLYPDMVVIIMTAFSSVSIAVEAIRMGASDFVTKPFNMDEIVVSIEKALEAQRLREEVSRLRTEEGQHYSFDAMLGESPVTMRLKGMIRSVASAPSGTVLLQGPSGVGKDLIAKIIHYNSPRAAMPFVNITCTAIAESLLESELFGHERGAFTDAREQKKGLVEIADGGTIFLDEIGDMPLSLQAKLLRFLEERKFRRVGGTVDQSVDVRVISATNRMIGDLVAAGLFREDLFYRLNSVPIHVPPLRDRQGDIELLAVHFAKSFSAQFRRSVPPQLAPEAIQRMRQYHWPGNIRELRNVIERAVLLGTDDQIRPEDLSIGGESLGTTTPVSTVASLMGERGVDLQDVERQLVQEAMRRTGGNQTRAARLLHISRDQLRYRLEKFGLLGKGLQAGN